MDLRVEFKLPMKRLPKKTILPMLRESLFDFTSCRSENPQ